MGLPAVLWSLWSCSGNLSAGNTLIIPSQGIDTSKVSRQAFLDVLDAIEEFKREATRESINEGLAYAKAHGARLRRPTKVNAYRDDVARLRVRD